MPIDHRHAPIGTLATLLSTEMNSLANNARAIGSAIDPTTDRHLFADYELAVTFGSAPAAGTTCELYLVPTVDGSNYADGSSSLTPAAAHLVCVFVLDNQTANRKIVQDRPYPGYLYKALIINKSGVAFPASGSTVKALPHSTRGV